MPPVRQQLCRINLSNSHSLCSGGCSCAPPVFWCHVHRQGQVRKKDTPRSLVPKIPSYVDGMTAPEQPLRPEAEGNTLALDVLVRLHMTSRIKTSTPGLPTPGAFRRREAVTG
jgi:hypothetical protein